MKLYGWKTFAISQFYGSGIQALPNWISGVLPGNFMRLLSSCQLEAEASVIPEVTRREEFTSKFTLGVCIQLGAETEFHPNLGPGFFKTIKQKYYIYYHTIYVDRRHSCLQSNFMEIFNHPCHFLSLVPNIKSK